MKNMKSICLIMSFLLSIFMIKMAQKPSCALVPEVITIDILQKKATKQEYYNWIDEEFAAIWKEIEDSYKISKKNCEEYADKFYDNYLQHITKYKNSFSRLAPLKIETIQFTQSIIKNFTIDSKLITIAPFDDGCAAGVDDCYLYISEERLLKRSQLAQKFTIAHELQHFLHKDDSLAWALKSLIAAAKSANSSTDHLILDKLSRMFELRADILAAFFGPEYAQGYREYAQYALKTNGIGKGATHPKNTLRLAYANYLRTII